MCRSNFYTVEIRCRMEKSHVALIKLCLDQQKRIPFSILAIFIHFRSGIVHFCATNTMLISTTAHGFRTQFEIHIDVESVNPISTMGHILIELYVSVSVYAWPSVHVCMFVLLLYVWFLATCVSPACAQLRRKNTKTKGLYTDNELFLQQELK